MSQERPEDVAFNMRYRAAVQDQIARTTASPAMRQFASKFARELRIQADLIEQGVPVDKILGPRSDSR